MISKELLSEVLNEQITYLEFKGDRTIQSGLKSSELIYVGLEQKRKKINIYELAHKCILFAYSKRFEITLRVMGAEIVSLDNGIRVKIIQREDITNPSFFDCRFIFKACEWILKEMQK